MPFQVHLSSILWGGNFKARSSTQSTKAERAHQHATTKKQKKMSDEANGIIKEDACMKFYDETKTLYIETDAPGVGLGADLLQTRQHELPQRRSTR